MMSVGPGSTITMIFDVGLPRPRDVTHPKAAQLYRDIEELLAPDVARSEERTA